MHAAKITAAVHSEVENGASTLPGAGPGADVGALGGASEGAGAGPCNLGAEDDCETDAYSEGCRSIDATDGVSNDEEREDFVSESVCV